jgi:spoIIIJ-associated protein
VGRRPLDAPAPKLTAADFVRAVERAESVAEPEDEAPQERRERREDRDRQRREPRRREEPEIEPNIDAAEVDFAAGIVDDLLRLLDISAEISLREPMTAGDGRGAALAVIDISGDDLGVLIGRRGETLVALQYLVNLIMGRRYPGQGGVTIDAEHYRVRREEQVTSLASRMADRVREAGDPITLEPMTAAERRLVHLLLADDPELETNSIGEGENRKVVISLRR